MNPTTLALLLLAGLGVSTLGNAATILAASCAPSAVQAAVDAAVAGDTVQLPTCTYATWDTTVTITKQIILEGTGTATTVLQRARVAASYESNRVPATSMPMRTRRQGRQERHREKAQG